MMNNTLNKLRWWILKIGIVSILPVLPLTSLYAFQTVTYDTLRGRLYEKESALPLKNAQLEIEGYKNFKTKTNEDGLFSFVLPTFMSTQASLKLLVKLTSENSSLPVQIRCTIDPRRKFINIPLKLPQMDKDFPTTQTENNGFNNQNLAFNKRNDSLQKSNATSSGQNSTGNDPEENALNEGQESGKYLRDKSLYTDKELAEYLENSDQRLKEVSQQKKTDSIFIEQYYDIVGEIQRIDIQLSEYEYLDNALKKKLIREVDTLEIKLKDLSEMIISKNKMHQAMIDKAELEIQKLRKLLESKNGYMILDKKLSISLLLAFFISLVFLAFLSYFLWNLKKQKAMLVQQNHQIKEHRDELKSLTESLSNTLISREVLLKEVHHRVKNNLQIIWGLLFLQSKKIQEEKAIWALENSQNRVYSIALVHEKLYQSKNLTEINFCDYLKALIHSISETYEQEGKNISFDLNILPVAFGVDHTMRLGLIINELISNSYKYAFPKKDKGKVWIELSKPEENLYTLTVRDNGVGIPPDLDAQHSAGLGFTLVDLLSKELRGSVCFERSKGTKITLSFKRPSKN